MKGRRFLILLSAGLVCAAGCGGSSAGSGSQRNVLPVTVSAAPVSGYVNGLFTSITVCVPGTTNCQTIDSVLVDTGSEGLRVLSSASGGQLSLALPQQKDGNGDPIVDCNPFVDGYTWGPVQLADVKMGDEEARSVPIQVIGDPSFASVPESCSGSGGPSENTLQTLGTYAILGVGPFAQDCGSICAESPTALNTENPGNVYYVCPASGCQSAAVAVDAQVQNPVALLPTDNNGVVIDLSSVSSDGAPSVTGNLFFGIGTLPNNELGSATVLPIDPDTLTFTTLYLGKAYDMSFIDSGSNAIYFLNSGTANMPDCPTPNDQFYCPDSIANFTATNRGTNGATSSATFSVASTDTLLASQSNVAFDDLAGPTGSSPPYYFDWGLPFFYGRKVFSALAGATAPGGKTPYFAY
jgi:hypothetical protein